MEIAGKTLKEICEMPLYAMTDFIRKNHDKKWGVRYNKQADTKKTYKVTICYSTREEHEDTYNIDAFSEEEAKDLAVEEWEEESDYDDEYEGASVKEINN